jgi:sarcosine oxidase subunit alpha
VVYDDGVLARLDEDRFVVSCSSGHAAGVLAALEAWRQDSFNTSRVVVHDLTAAWGTIAISGPRSRELVTALGLGVDLDDKALPHMALAHGRFDGRLARIARVSFTGDRSYEVSVPATLTERLWGAAIEAGHTLDIRAIGLEALSVMRAEKGYIIVGRDTDGTTMPQDLGVTGPRDKRTDEFVGRRSLFLEAAKAENRRQLVGLEADGAEPLGTGAHAAYLAGERPRSIGYVTSSYASPTLGRPIALGLVENGRARLGDMIDIHHLGRRRRARIVEPCFLDPKGERLDA